MRIPGWFPLALLLIAPPAHPQDAPADDASVRQLIEVMDADKMLDEMWGQIDGMMTEMMKESLSGMALTAEQEQIVADMNTRIVAHYREVMSWTKLEPMFIDIYRKTLSQREVDGMLAFYKSDVGQSVLAKMPAIMQHSTEAMSEHIRPLIPGIQAIVEESLARLKATMPPS